MKVAVVLFNLGGPDHLEAVRPFLANLFSDPAIIGLPTPLRQLIARLITAKRLKTAQKIYTSIGGRSPILENTQAQARALEKQLNAGSTTQFKCVVAMRYWHPFAAGAAHAVKEFAPDQIILLPLYPQFSTTTTASSFKAWRRMAKKLKITAPQKEICCYPEEPGFVKALADATRVAYAEAGKFGKPRLLFSAHGLPEKIVKSGDPYAFQCERTAKALITALGIENPDWVLCYQSRVGPLRWIGPATDDEIKRAGCDKVPLVIVPIAFVSEHSETLYELDILYRELAARSGVPHFARVPTVGVAPDFINGLTGLVRSALAGKAALCVCPAGFAGCGRE